MNSNNNLSEIENLAKGLALVKTIVEKQRKRAKRDNNRTESGNGSDFDQNLRVFNDLSIKLSFDLNFETKREEFARKVIIIRNKSKQQLESDLDSAPKWFQPINSFNQFESIGNGFEKKEIKKKKDLKRFLTILPKISSKEEKIKEIKEKEIKESICESNQLKAKEIKKKSYDVIAVRKWMSDRKRKQISKIRPEPEVTDKEYKSMSNIDNKKKNKKKEIIEEKVIEMRAESRDLSQTKEFNIISIDESVNSKPEETEPEVTEPEMDLCDRVREVVERASREVPDWESICERVYRNRDFWIKSPKAMEVFPKSKKNINYNKPEMDVKCVSNMNSVSDSDKDIIENCKTLSTLKTLSFDISVENVFSDNTEKEIISETGNSLKLSKNCENVLKRVSEIRKDLNLNSICDSEPKVTSHDLFRLTSDLEDVVNDDTDDEIPELKSEPEIESRDSHIELIANLDIEALVRSYCRQLFDCGPDERRIRSMTSFEDNLSAFRLFLFDFSKEIVLQTIDFTIKAPKVLKLNLEIPISLQKKAWPKTADQLYALVSERAYDWLYSQPIRADVRKDGLMAFCRKNKSRDFVDSILFREMSREDWRWTHFYSDQQVIKERITDLILDHIIVESMREWRQLNPSIG